jgi:hypothetical protein
MSTLEDLDDLERDGKKEEEQNDKNQKPDGSGDADMKDADEKKKDEEEIWRSSTQAHATSSPDGGYWRTTPGS